MSKEPINFDLENCQYEVLELKDLVFVHDFCMKNLIVNDESRNCLKDKFSEQELRTIGWPVSMMSNKEFLMTDPQLHQMPFAMLRPVRNPHYNG